MASPAIHIQQGHVALTAVCARLGELLRVEAPTLPASSRFGTEATMRFQWESLLAWLQAQSPPIPDGLEVTKNEGGVFTIRQVAFAGMGSTFVGDAPAESDPTDESAPMIAPAAEPVAVVSEAERLAGIYVSVTGVLVYLMLYVWYPPAAVVPAGFAP